MTITYTAEVATCKKFGCFIKLLARWRGSIYKLVWMDLLLFLSLYYSLNLVYIHLLDENSQRTFESVVYYCASYTSLIPLSFVLGFYVNLVMTRWWEQYITIPWPDSLAVYVSAHLHGQDERGRVMRRTVVRYVCLCLTIVFTQISPCVKKRFPKLKHLVEAGLLLENEKSIIESMDNAFPNYPKHWMPIIWAASIITRARQEGIIRDDFAVKTIIDELNNFRGKCGVLMYYDFISIPLVYTQVVTIAVYSFFVCSLLAHQRTEFKKDTYESLDFYMPIFITLQFFFYMGWLKVAETLINPFGEDDDDFEVNWMIDRNLQVSYLIVDEMHHEHPELVKDQYWDEVCPNELPYETEVKREQHPKASTAKYDVHESPIRSITSMQSDIENVGAQGNSSISILRERFKQAFQRFAQYSEDPSNPPEAETLANPSISEIESLQNITLYGPTQNSEESIQLQWDNTDKRPVSTLDMVFEEEEVEMEPEVECEELLYEQEGEETTSTYAPDTDLDLFEKLRVEREQQRLQRIQQFLERYLRTNFNISTIPENLLPFKGKQQTDISGDIKTTKCGEKKSQPKQPHISMTLSIDSNLSLILDNLNLSGENSTNPQKGVLVLGPPFGASANDSNPPNIAFGPEVHFMGASPKSEEQSPQLTALFPLQQPFDQRPEQIDASSSPLGSANSRSTVDSSEPDDWEVIAKTSRSQGQPDL